MGYFSSAFCPFPPGRKDIFPVVVATSFVQRGATGLPSYARICGFLLNSVVLTWQVSRFTWLKMDQVQGSTGKWHTEVLFPLLLAGSGLI
jgi:hypothetical protein